MQQNQRLQKPPINSNPAVDCAREHRTIERASLQQTCRQAIKQSVHDLVNKIHKIETAKHFIQPQ